ncbi:putative gtp-binding protein sas1 [Diaporthe ampelina]|uniref:Putative gtp-binding protein sas1 n=1 Tax=Diaporthe ampelina TaxID=1214573 RepID=A0A0G2I1M4_9PEZI|nr:putative gtp-binding protein sas1 [Diaporthe ampelina]
MRQHVLAKGEYDAVLLVYDVSDRRSFDKVREFHAEVSLVNSNGTKNHKRQRPRNPRTHSGPPTGSSLQRRSSVMSFFSPGGGLVGSEEDVEAAKDSSGGVVVALVGNKADIGDGDCGLSEKTEEEDELLEQDDDFDDDCESALAVFGDALHRDLREEDKPGVTSSVLGITSRPKPTHAESSETVERWLQIIGKAAEDERDCAAPEVTVSRAKPGRSVSKAEGEDLARSLELQVPFIETSARTGTNVEEAFEAVVRSVLKQMGRSATPSTTEVAKRCRDRHEAEQQKHIKAKNKVSMRCFRLAKIWN